MFSAILIIKKVWTVCSKMFLLQLIFLREEIMPLTLLLKYANNMRQYYTYSM